MSHFVIFGEKRVDLTTRLGKTRTFYETEYRVYDKDTLLMKSSDADAVIRVLNDILTEKGRVNP